MQSAYQLGDNLGIPRGDKCSIPQGCPFSMTMVATIVRPWIMLMIENEVTPRVLADDLLISTEGVGHLSRTVKNVEASFKYLEDIGAKVADNKCFTFASDSNTHKYLRDKNEKTQWQNHTPQEQLQRSGCPLKLHQHPKWSNSCKKNQICHKHVQKIKVAQTK